MPPMSSVALRVPVPGYHCASLERALGGLFGDAIIATGPMMLAYLIVAVFTTC